MSRIARYFQVAAALCVCACPQISNAATLMNGESYRVSRDSLAPYGRPYRETVLFRRLLIIDAGPPRWAVERREIRWNKGVWEQRHEWIDSRRCEQVTTVLSQIDDLPAPRLKGPRPIIGLPQIPPSHSPVVTLEAIPTNMGGRPVRISIQDSHFGAVALWWDAAARALAHCWTDDPVVVGDEPIPSTVPEFENPPG